MQITNRNTHTAWAAKVDELLELYLAIRGDELLKRRDFVPQLLAPLTWCLHKVYNNKKKKKTFRIQNVQVMLMSEIRQASKLACCAYKRGLHANKTTSVTFIID